MRCARTSRSGRPGVEHAARRAPRRRRSASTMSATPSTRRWRTPRRSSSPAAVTGSGSAAGASVPPAVERPQQRSTMPSSRPPRRQAELARRPSPLAAAERALQSARSAEAELTRRLDANDARFSAASEGLARAQGEHREVLAELANLERSIVDLTAQHRARRPAHRRTRSVAARRWSPTSRPSPMPLGPVVSCVRRWSRERRRWHRAARISRSTTPACTSVSSCSNVVSTRPSDVWLPMPMPGVAAEGQRVDDRA